MSDKFYEKFNRKSSVANAKNQRKQFNKERDAFFENKRTKKNNDSQFKNANEKNNNFTSNKIELDAKFISSEKLFNSSLQKESLAVLENFDKLIQDIRPLNSKQFLKLPKDIRELSHQLTDERDSRRLGYMNANEELSAYIRYFTWWNLIRLTRIFSNLDSKSFNLNDGDYCIDIGSGPLTVVTALWLSRPELREKQLTWYCVDISSSTLSLGEDIYLSVAAKNPPKNTNAQSHWNIIRIKGECGVQIKNKAKLITCANMFNELSQKNNESPDVIAESQINKLLSYGTNDASYFIAEPGMPVAAHFISLMRDKFIKNNFTIETPCPHAKSCAMNGLHARYGGTAKWCNFSFNTDDAPAKLLKLSKDAQLPKTRAVLSFIFATKQSSTSEIETKTENKITNLRIASDCIKLPENEYGYYACSEFGLALVINSSHRKIENGDKIKVSMLKNTDTLKIDQKTGAKIIKL